jgi:hypothetical protein
VVDEEMRVTSPCSGGGCACWLELSDTWIWCHCKTYRYFKVNTTLRRMYDLLASSSNSSILLIIVDFAVTRPVHTNIEIVFK